MAVHIQSGLGAHRLHWLSLAAPAVLAIMLNGLFGVFMWNEVVLTHERSLTHERLQAELLRCDWQPDAARRAACRAQRLRHADSAMNTLRNGGALPNLIDDVEPDVNLAQR